MVKFTTDNIPARLNLRNICPEHEGLVWESYTNNYVYSKYNPIATINYLSGREFICSCAFSEVDDELLIGTSFGNVKVFDLRSGKERTTYGCHEHPINTLLLRRDGKFLITACEWRRSDSTMWRMVDNNIDDDGMFLWHSRVEFSNVCQDKIIATTLSTGVMYDVETQEEIAEFSSDTTNGYSMNRATLNPTDKLVLSDGVLYDVLSRKVVHCLNKTSSILNGVFHPNGIDVISGSEVIDLRIFKSFATLPDIKDCLIHFTGSVFFSHRVGYENQATYAFEGFSMAFKCHDGSSYSEIATFDVGKNVYEMSVSNSGALLAVVQNSDYGDDSVSSSCVKVYHLGGS